jgi:hypothetical protein
MFPAFILAKLYVKGSLKNSDNGFEFLLKNIIDSTQLMGIGPVIVEEHTYSGEAITMIAGEKTYHGADLSRQNTAPIKVGVPMTIQIQGEPLSPGMHNLTISATTIDIGKIRFEIKDTVA